jgi:hypothetical protein
MAQQTIASDSIHNSEQGVQDGLTKREYFAAMAMQALLSDSNSIALTPHCVAEFSIQMSEILINELNKKK